MAMREKVPVCGQVLVPGAVVDARGAVHGIDRLRVADASVMPAIPAANTNLSTIVIAERIAQGPPAHDRASSGLPHSAMSLRRALRTPSRRTRKLRDRYRPTGGNFVIVDRCPLPASIWLVRQSSRPECGGCSMRRTVRAGALHLV